MSMDMSMNMKRTRITDLDAPIHSDTPMCSGSFNRVFILLYHKMFPTLEAGMGGCQT